MVTPRQRKKQRSGQPRLTRRNHNKKAKAKIYGNAIVRENWDMHATLTQNYERMGLVVTPNYVTGGKEKINPEPKLQKNEKNAEPTAEELEEVRRSLGPGQAIVRRDDEGNIIEIIHGKERTFDDILDEKVQSVPAKTEVTKKLEEEASRKDKPRKKLPLSAFELSYVSKLLNKYGTEDFESMAKDVKLNPKLLSSAKLKQMYSRMQT
ncbi:ribosome biogenesis protein Nop16 [Schizosaccharomyces cryophilus OY26]|uniref:Nucleolar protein 16 n=1 Tax=Schizosaccharomyces cryophilus (strain OY26 / ATCC MYA-4695 / CBS 11777 / NBRC 106824 / NRRL Y48691) TaxID=653667 RepID=S9WZL3_SCHCR|nr:ribosome biogenesis protein Nop16 [Schizosaccharomyces cryophilus OY26]EPY50162.1 ribosome biogenesis protein Nop16 [Schizosaccharomyces cryophilus OY26]